MIVIDIKLYREAIYDKVKNSYDNFENLTNSDGFMQRRSLEAFSVQGASNFRGRKKMVPKIFGEDFKIESPTANIKFLVVLLKFDY